MKKVITVTDMIRSFSDIIGHVYYKGETFDIKKGTNIVARLIPAKMKPTIVAGELEAFFNNAPPLSKEEVNELEQDIANVKKLNITGELKWE